MKNLLSYLKSKQVDVLENTSGYPVEVQEIHHEFDIAADKLLEEANQIIKESAHINVNKAERLKALGFEASSEVAKIEPIQKKVAISKEQIELVHYYKKEYPFNKFIVEEQVKEICHKYNLVFGDVTRYTGFVPEKNLVEIERFKLKETEKDFVCLTNKDITISANNVKIVRSGDYYHIWRKGFNRYETSSFQSNDGIVFYGRDRGNNFGVQDTDFIMNLVLSSGCMKICAPVKDMNISGLELKEGYKLIKKHIPDPVVLQPVKGGYLIVTAWGDEASDPIIQNELNS